MDRGRTTSTASSPSGERARSPTCSTGSSGAPPTGASRRRRSTSTPSRRLAARYGVNRARFWVRPGLAPRPLPAERPTSAVSEQPDASGGQSISPSTAPRSAVSSEGRSSARLTDQYLPPSLPGFTRRADLPAAPSELRGKPARSHAATRGAARPSSTRTDFPPDPRGRAGDQAEPRADRPRGRDQGYSAGRPTTAASSATRTSRGTSHACGWLPDYLDPYTYLNLLFDGRFARRRQQPAALRRAEVQPPAEAGGSPTGQARYRAYGAARRAARPRGRADRFAIDYANEPTLVSARVDPRCIILRPTLLLNAVCLK